MRSTHVSKYKIRQFEIAREADVSIATVDRVLNSRPGVNVHTARRIMDAVGRLERRRSQSASGRPAAIRFDFVLPGGTNTFMSLLEAGIESAGQAYKGERVRLRCHRIEGFNPQILAKSIREIGSNSSGLAVVALENPIVREAVNDVCDLGVPVVTLVSNLSTPKKLGYVGLDNRAAGRTAGYLIGRLARQRPGKTAIFEGSLDLSYRDHQERDIGFRDALKEHAPGLEIVGRWETQDNFEESYRQTMAMLEAHPDVLGLYSVGSGVRGIAHALVERGVAKKVVFIGHDLTKFTRQFLIDGTMDAIIHQDPDRQARLAVETLLGHHDGATAKSPELLKVEVFFRENLP